MQILPTFVMSKQQQSFDIKKQTQHPSRAYYMFFKWFLDPLIKSEPLVRFLFFMPNHTKI